LVIENFFSEKLMFCPECGAEYREGFETCSDCGVALVTEKEFRKLQEARRREEDRRRAIETVEVYSVQGEAEAGIIRSLLEANGIESFATGTNVQSVYPITVDGLGQLRIMVRKEDAGAARKIVEENIQGNYETRMTNDESNPNDE
jgi:hypothetical protein